MTTSTQQVGYHATYPTDGATALKSFNPSALAEHIANRNNRFHLNLVNHSLIGVMDAYATFKRRNSPSFKNGSVISAIRALQEAIGLELMPIDVTDIFYDEFKTYLHSVRNVKPTTIRNYFDHIRAALVWGSQHCCPVSETYKCYKVENYEKTKIALSPSQIAHIYYYEIDRHHDRIKELLKTYPIHRFSFVNLKRVQDQFVLEANTAQRYSDAHRISESNFDETKTIMRITQQKTGSKARVNIANYAIDRKITYEILNNYNYESPTKNIEITNFNKYLHLLLQAIGGEFLKPVITENKIQGELVRETKPLWQMISSHTARRTFVSYHLNHGKNLVQIQKCTGHKDLRSIQAYCILDED